MTSAVSSPMVMRRRIAVEAGQSATMHLLEDGAAMPLVFRGSDLIDAAEWARTNRPLIQAKLDDYGALLFRGFHLPDASAFRAFVAAVSPGLLEYKERAAPRKEKVANIYSSTEYPPEYPIPLHHEMAYCYQWPLKIWFYCALPSRTRGATPLADDRLFFRRLDPRIRKQFEEKQVMYVRNYSPGLDMPWQEVFQTSRTEEVEAYCREAGMQCVWRDRNRLRTIRIAAALRPHPRTGAPLWFNHAHLFHVSNLEAELREAILSQVDPEDYPRNVYYGDGSPIATEDLEHVRGTYDEVSVRFDWEAGDLMLVDNMAVAHGREPFSGPRTILVAMTDPA